VITGVDAATETVGLTSTNVTKGYDVTGVDGDIPNDGIISSVTGADTDMEAIAAIT